jgi:hypothetical protein
LPDGKPLAPLTLGGHDTYNLMAGYKWQPRPGQFVISYVQIGAAHAAGVDLEQNVVSTAFRLRQLYLLQGQSGRFQNHCTHVVPLSFADKRRLL